MTCSSRPTVGRDQQSSYLTFQPPSTRSTMTFCSTESMTNVVSLARCSAGSRPIFEVARAEAVAVRSALSQTTNIRFSVPQGSVLGSKLFTIYIYQLTSATAIEGVTSSMASLMTPKLGSGSPSNQMARPTSHLSSSLFPPGAFNASVSFYHTASSSTSRRPSSSSLRAKAR